MTIKNNKMTTKMLPILAIITVAAIVTSVSVASALSICESPNCMQIRQGEDTYKLRGDALVKYNDIQTRSIDFIALKEQLKFVPDSIGPIFIALDGDKNEVEQFVSSYSVDIKSQKSTDTFVSLVGTTSKQNLEKYFNNVSHDDYINSGFGIAHLGTHTDENGTIGNGSLPLTLEQQNLIGSLSDGFANQKVVELLLTSDGVEKIQK